MSSATVLASPTPTTRRPSWLLSTVAGIPSSNSTMTTSEPSALCMDQRRLEVHPRVFPRRLLSLQHAAVTDSETTSAPSKRGRHAYDSRQELLRVPGRQLLEADEGQRGTWIPEENLPGLARSSFKYRCSLHLGVHPGHVLHQGWPVLEV